MGNRDDIDEMSGGNASVLITVLKLIDKYDLYGLVSFPKHHKQADVPEIYRLCAKTKVSKDLKLCITLGIKSVSLSQYMALFCRNILFICNQFSV